MSNKNEWHSLAEMDMPEVGVPIEMKCYDGEIYEGEYNFNPGLEAQQGYTALGPMFDYDDVEYWRYIQTSET